MTPSAANEATMGLTVADHQEHEGPVAQQPQDGRRVGVAFRGYVPGLRLGLRGRNLGLFLEHWTQTQSPNELLCGATVTNPTNHHRPCGLIRTHWFYCVSFLFLNW